MKNGMFWSEIEGRFKKNRTSHSHGQFGGLTPPPPPPAYRAESFNISFATHARINEIKTGNKKLQSWFGWYRWVSLGKAIVF